MGRKREKRRKEKRKKGRNEREEGGKMETREPILKEKKEEFVCHFLFSPSEFGTSSVPSGWQRDVVLPAEPLSVYTYITI